MHALQHAKADNLFQAEDHTTQSERVATLRNSFLARYAQFPEMYLRSS